MKVFAIFMIVLTIVRSKSLIKSCSDAACEISNLREKRTAFHPIIAILTSAISTLVEDGFPDSVNQIKQEELKTANSQEKNINVRAKRTFGPDFGSIPILVSASRGLVISKTKEANQKKFPKEIKTKN